MKEGEEGERGEGRGGGGEGGGRKDKNLVLCGGKDKMKNFLVIFFFNSVILYFRVFYQPS